MDITSAGLNNTIDFGIKFAVKTRGFNETLDAVDVKFGMAYIELFIKLRHEAVEDIVKDCPDLKPLLQAVQDTENSSEIGDAYIGLLIKEGQLLNRAPDYIKKDINWLILMSCYLSLEEDKRDTAVKMLEEILEMLVTCGRMYRASVWILASALWISDYPSYRKEVLNRYKKDTDGGEQAVQKSYANSQSSNTSSSSHYDNNSGGCYVATAVYGSYDCPEVWTLRRFRDFQLEKSWYGRIFIKLYYAISPILVKHFGAEGWFQRFWKGKLDRLVANLKANGFDDTPYCD